MKRMERIERLERLINRIHDRFNHKKATASLMYRHYRLVQALDNEEVNARLDEVFYSHK